MGEVYRARDTRLDRTVAIKVLPESLAADPQLRERFDREARAISSLNHPHICTLHDVGHENGIDYLVLEYLDGETLDARLKAGAPSAENGTRGFSRANLGTNEALQIAIQIADALATAHRAGVIHRDLKPANVMLTKAGAKLLDFGLAKNAAPAIATSGLSMAPTTPPNLTAQGTILGTFQYMAPEQIEGVDADARTDIFAFGAVLFEMLTGRPAFEGKTRAQLLGAILKDEPPPVSTVLDARLKPRAPMSSAVDRIVTTCLAKDPDDRWQTARDLLRELKWVADVGPVETGPHARNEPRETSRTWRPALAGPIAWATAGVLTTALIATGTLALRHLRETPPAADPLQFTISPPATTQFGGPAGNGTGAATQLAVSPDGRHVVFVAQSEGTHRLWLRSLASLAERQIPGSENVSFPFWSPDSRFIAFFAGGKLKKVQVSGGPPVVLCDVVQGRGGAWNRDNVIVFGSLGSALARVSSAGGSPVAVAKLDSAYSETSHRWPHFLPDGRHFVFTAVTGASNLAPKPSRIRLGSLDSTDTIDLFQAESSVAYSSGHLLFVRDGTLMAQPFDATAARTAGDPFPIAEQVSSEGSRYAGFSVTSSGTLAYAHGSSRALNRLAWFDRGGRRLGELGDPGLYVNVALSPDERHVAVTMTTGTAVAAGNQDVWILDVARGTASRLTFDPAAETSPIWSPDSSHVVFLSGRPEYGLRRKLASGTSDEELLMKSRGTTALLQDPDDWSPDGRFIAYETQPSNSGTLADIWILPLSGDRTPYPFVQGPGIDMNAAFSPDGRWLAYSSGEFGASQVYVQPFPAAAGRFQVSRNGGNQPRWRGDGKELFFLSNERTMMAATIVDASTRFEADLPRELFKTTLASSNARRTYAVTKDGKRFLLITAQAFDQNAAQPLTVVVNWLAAVQK
jgi:serine/threonine protein kinase/Tol biopolymer transport system component